MGALKRTVVAAIGVCGFGLLVPGSTLAELETLLSRAWRDGLNERFEHLRAARAYTPDDVAAGRAYVAAYVEFVHYVERLHAAATHDAHGHYEQR